jgi:(+)-trans-carveol dehydrogenase
MAGRLAGKVAFITGAARGQGREHAVAMAREGADIIATDICGNIEGVPYDLGTWEELEETARLVEAEDRRCVPIRADARSTEQITTAADEGAAALGGIDIAVINHGIVMFASWDTMDDESFGTMIDTNLVAVWRASRAVIPHMIKRGGGSLSITASSAAKVAFYGIPSYVVAKHGVLGLMKVLAVELGPHWIRVNALCPGNVATPMFFNQVTLDAYHGGPGGTRADAEFPAEAASLLPLPWMPASAISDAAVFLASDEGRFITGSAFEIDHGMTIQPPGIPPLGSTRIAELTNKVAELEARLAQQS